MASSENIPNQTEVRGINLHITRRTFVKGVGLVAIGAGTGLAGCSPAPTNQADTSSGGEQSALSAVEEQTESSSSQQPAPLLAIIHTNDTHGHDVEIESTDDTQGNFSMAAIPQLKEEWEAKGYEVLVVDVGDATQGMPLVDQSSGEAAITFMNACGYMAMAVGNHEFDRGPEELKTYKQMAEFPLLSANVVDAQTNELVFQPSTTVELKSGTKVGFFGLTTPSTTTTCKPSLVQEFRFLGGDELYACAQQQVDSLRAEGCDLVVCLGHLGNEISCQPSTSTNVLENVQGIDLFLDGHDHQLVEDEVAGTLLVETGCYFRNIGVVAIEEGVSTNESISYGEFSGIDTSAQAVIDSIDAQVEDELNVALGHTAFFLDGNRNPGLRTQETNLGDFCADAIMWAAGEAAGVQPDAAIINGGGIRSSLEVGDITLGNIKTVFAFSNQVVILKVTGAQLLEALEAGYQSVGVEPIGAFPQVAGMEVSVDTTVPYEAGELYPDSTFYGPAVPGSRVTIRSIGGQSWSAEETYLIAMSDFLALGGDTYYAFKQAADAETPITCDFDYESLASYLIVACNHEVPESYAQPQGRIQIIG